jgi:hypothetical protein
VQTLTGQKIDTGSNYCIGVFKNNSLFLNPITNFMQFRHDFSNIEGNNEVKKKIKEKNAKRNITLSNEIRDIDKFSDLTFFQKDSIHSGQCYEKLYFDDTSEAKNAEFLNPFDYYQLMFGNMNREVLIEAMSKNDRALTFNQIIKLPVHHKIEYILRKVPILSFESLKMILRELRDQHIPDKELLELTLKYARILKNGNLILKTELKYDDNMKNEIAMKRNYFINLLQNNPEGITKSDIKYIEKREIDELVLDLAYSSVGKLFLKESNIENSEFIKTFISYYDADIDYWNNTTLRKGTTQVHSQSVRSQTETIEAHINKIFTRADIVQFQSLYEQIRSELPESSENDKLINESISKYCHIVNGVCYSKDVKDNEANDVRNKLFELFKKKKSVKKAEIREFIVSAGLNVTDSYLNRILKSIANSDKNEWKLKIC